MKPQHSPYVLLLALALVAVPLAPSVGAQSTPAPAPNQMTQDQKMPEEDRGSTQKIFTGTIMKVGDKLVLNDAAGKMKYKLDDQQKAQEYLNKSVKVTGVLDASTGTIRVTSIEPA